MHLNHKLFLALASFSFSFKDFKSYLFSSCFYFNIGFFIFKSFYKFSTFTSASLIVSTPLLYLSINFSNSTVF